MKEQKPMPAKGKGKKLQHNKSSRKTARVRRKSYYTRFWWLGLTVLMLAFLSFVLLRSQSDANPFRNATAQNVQRSSSPGNFLNSSDWQKQTLALLSKTHTWNGAYTGNFSAVVNGSYDLYTTHYAVLIYKTLGIPIPNQDATIQTLQNKQSSNSSSPCAKSTTEQMNSQGDAFSCMYYRVMILNRLGVQPNDKQFIIRYVNALQSKSGVYASNLTRLKQLNSSLPDVYSNILATREALTILNALGSKPQQSENLKTWLLAQWGNDALFTNAADQWQKISALAGLGECLELLGIQLRNLPQTPARLAWANHLSGSLLDIKANALSTNLFVITDWLHLLRSLSGTSTNLIPASFWRRLSSFQQTGGGFNVFLGNEPDIQGTYLAVALFKEAGQSIPRIADIQSLLDRLALDKGGFLPVVRVPPGNPMFTAMSLEIASFLDKDISKTINYRALKEFAQQCMNVLLQPSNQSAAAKAQLLYYTVMLLKAVHLNSQPLSTVIHQESELFANALKDNQPLTNAQLTESYYLSQLLSFNDATQQKLIHNILLLRNPDGAFEIGWHSSLQYTWLALSVLNAMKANALSSQDRQRTIAWIQQQQTTQGGYQEAGIANVYSSYWAVESLSFLEEKSIVDPKLMRWLKSLEAADGGIEIAPSQENAPDLIATDYALLIAQQMNIDL